MACPRAAHVPMLLALAEVAGQQTEIHQRTTEDFRRMGGIRMWKVEHYICEVCGTEYKDKALCEKCERLHKQGLTIVRARFLPVTQDNTGMPVTIEVEVKDGKETRRATYKR